MDAGARLSRALADALAMTGGFGENGGRMRPVDPLAPNSRRIAMNRLSLSLLLCACAMFASPAYSADAAAGKKLSADSCVDCHGDDGKGDDEVPGIAGLSVDKFTKAIQEYQNGTRTKSAKMAKEAKKLSATDIANLAAYYSTLK
jgi:cytochrome c553